MEDGSALTPLMANHLLSGHFSGQLSSQPSLHYFRLLAKLAHCPLYFRPGFHQQQHQSSNQTGSSAHQMAADEAKSNAMTFECLRHKPVEQIMQRIPLELLQLNQLNGDLSINSRWLKNHFQEVDLPLQLEPIREPNQQKLFSISSFSTQLDSSQLNKLVMQITREQVNRERAGFDSSTSTSTGRLQLFELFSAIYGQPSGSLRPLFGPLVDGTIVPDEDVAANMLMTGASFGQRDLMIGLSQPALAPSEASNRNEVQPEPPRAPFAVADRIWAQLEQEGLTSEQALELVNLFVRSFYKHHNQEIANSILNHYLNVANPFRWPNRKRVRLNPTRERAEGSEEENELKLRQQQLLVLDSMFELFQDVLTNVPVLKAALIHAAKQLDSLTEVFAGQQFEKWKQSRLDSNSNPNQNSGQGSSSESNGSSSSSLHGLERRQLLDSFAHFARQLFNHSSWPLELHFPATSQPSQLQQTLQQPRATYLYQLDANLLIRGGQEALERLNSVFVSSQQAPKQRKSSETSSSNLLTSALSSIKDNLAGILVKLQAGHVGRQLSLACAFDLPESPEAANDLAGQLRETICARFGQLLARFASNGKVNVEPMEDFSVQSSTADLFLDRVDQYARECLDKQLDHHSVQPEVTESNSPNELNECQLKLNKLTVECLLGAEESESSLPGQSWSVFNLFSQQVASLPAPNKLGWERKQIVDDEQHYGEQKLSLSSKASFWSNFIPALNCSTTKPILPGSLLTSSARPSSLNSSLLSLNLVFSCQRGATTALDLMDSLAETIEQKVETNIERWNALQFSTPSQNHHNLRMANMSQSGLTSGEESREQQQLAELATGEQSKSRVSSISSDSELVQAIGSGLQKQDEARFKYVGVLLIVGGLVVSLTLASVAFVVRLRLRQKRNRRKSSRQLDVAAQQVHPETSFTQHEHSNGFQPRTSIQVGNSSQFVELEEAPNEPEEEVGEVGQVFNQFEQSSSQLACQSSFEESNEQVFGGRNGILYWDGSAGSCANNSRATLSLCRSHSSLEVSKAMKGTKLAQNGVEVSPSDQATCSEQEPIMMPILTRPFEQLNGSNLQADQYKQSERVGSWSKKRVKISDPVGSIRRSKQAFRCAHQNNNQASLPDSLFCPVHRNLSKPALATEQTNFYLNEAFVAGSGPIQVWNQHQIELVQEPSQNSSESGQSQPQPQQQQQHQLAYFAQAYPVEPSQDDTSGFNLPFMLNNYARNTQPILNHRARH